MKIKEIAPKSKRGGARPGAGRPRGTIKAKVNRVRLTADIDVNAAAELGYIANKYGVSKSDALSVILSTYEESSFPVHKEQYQGVKALIKIK